MPESDRARQRIKRLFPEFVDLTLPFEQVQAGIAVIEFEAELLEWDLMISVSLYERALNLLEGCVDPTE